MVNCCEFGYTLQATAADLVIRYGPLSGMKLQTNYQSAKVHNNFFDKLATSFNGTVMIKIVCTYTVTSNAFTTQVLNPR